MEHCGISGRVAETVSCGMWLSEWTGPEMCAATNETVTTLVTILIIVIICLAQLDDGVNAGVGPPTV